MIDPQDPWAGAIPVKKADADPWAGAIPVKADAPDLRSSEGFQKMTGLKRVGNVSEGANGPSVFDSASDRFLKPIKEAPSQLLNTVLNPKRALSDTAWASVDQLSAAKNAAGDVFAPGVSIGRRGLSAMEAAGHLAGATPLIGPAAAHAADTAGRGDLAGAAGELAVLGGSLGAPELLKTPMVRGAVRPVGRAVESGATAVLKRVGGMAGDDARTLLERGQGTLTKANSAQLAKDVPNEPIEVGREYSERLAREDGPGPTTEPIMGENPALRSAADAHANATTSGGPLSSLLKVGKMAAGGGLGHVAAGALGVPGLAIPLELAGSALGHPATVTGAAQGAFNAVRLTPAQYASLARASLLAQLTGEKR